MSDTQSIPVAVIGVGRMGNHHARIYHELPGAQLVAVVDHDMDRAEIIADNYGCDAVPDVATLLERYPNVQAVTIAVPTVFHEDIAVELLSHGVACLVEKPLAQSVKSATRIVEAADAADTLVQVGHTERFNPAVRAVAEMDFMPRFIEVDRVSPLTFRSIDVGVVFDLMIHDLDIVLMMTKSPLVDVRASGIGVIGKHEDVANARLEFENGCVANITASRLALKTERKLRVFSESAYISLDYAKRTGIAIQRTDNVDALREVREQVEQGADLSDLDYMDLVNIRELTINDEEPLRAELSNFLDAVAGHEKPEVDARAGSAAVDAAERVVTAINEHSWHDLDLMRIGELLTGTGPDKD